MCVCVCVRVCVFFQFEISISDTVFLNFLKVTIKDSLEDKCIIR